MEWEILTLTLIIDGEIQVSEAEAVLGLYIGSASISSLVGIESFVNIERLAIWFNELTSVDVTHNTNLLGLNFWGNNLTSLDVTQNPNLEILSCGSNQLTSLDVTQNLNLTRLNCFNNNLTSLDVSQNPNLELLYCDDNQLTSLDVSQNPDLAGLYCDDNQLTSLDVSQNPNLGMLFCFNNQLASLNLKSGNNNDLLSMLAYGNPNLTCIQVDDAAATYPECDLVNYSGWCKDEIAMYSEECLLGSDDYSSIVFTMFPNPTHNVLNIQSSSPVALIQIYSIAGALIKETSDSSINVSELHTGLYFAKVSMNGKTLTKKFIKN